MKKRKAKPAKSFDKKTPNVSTQGAIQRLQSLRVGIQPSSPTLSKHNRMASDNTSNNPDLNGKSHYSSERVPNADFEGPSSIGGNILSINKISNYFVNKILNSS